MNTKSIFQFLFYSLIGLAVSFSLPIHAEAAFCTPIYGGGPTCTENSLSVEKKVLNPTTNLFVHDLGLSDPKYHSNDLVTFQITLANNSNNPIQHIVVKDTFPKELTFADGPGTFDAKTRSLSFTINNLAAHHAQQFTINTHVVSQDLFPQDTFCIGNQATATPNAGALVQDSSQLCVEKISTTPSTGPEALGLFALIPTAAAGLGLKKLSKRSN